MPRALAADIGQRPRLLQRVAARASRRQDDAVAQLREREEIAPVERHLHDLPVLDDVADFRVGGPQQRFAAGHHDLLGDAAGLELEIDGQVLAEAQRDVGSDGAPEPGELCGERVAAGPQRGQEVAPLAVGDALDARAALALLGHDDDAGQHATLGVADDTGDLTCIGLGGGGNDHRRDQHNGQGHTHGNRPLF